MVRIVARRDLHRVVRLVPAVALPGLPAVRRVEVHRPAFHPVRQVDLHPAFHPVRQEEVHQQAEAHQQAEPQRSEKVSARWPAELQERIL